MKKILRYKSSCRRVISMALLCLMLPVISIFISTMRHSIVNVCSHATYETEDFERTDTPPPPTMHDKRYMERSRRLNNQCFRYGIGKARRIITNRNPNMTYCIVPKAACTFWINIFLYLNDGDMATGVDHPSEIPRFVTHFRNNLEVLKLTLHDHTQETFDDSLRFMFVRDPYSRLWSAWIDKFLLPDFWLTHGIFIAKYLNITEMFGCPRNINFVQFLSYVTRDYFMKHPDDLNEHWSPIKYTCDACLFRPHVIGKLETFQEDTRVLLAATNLSWIMTHAAKKSEKDDDSNTNHDLHEMAVLTEYNTFRYYLDKRINLSVSCGKKKEIYQRLWKAFQYNGHLPSNVTFPDAKPYTPDEFLEVCKKTYYKWTSRNAQEKAKQKRDAMINAYKEVPREIMERIQKLFESDFKQFGYDSKPKDLYY